MSPAGAAVLGQVLVANLSHEVGSCNIIPDPLFREVGGGEGALDHSGASFSSDTAGGSGLTVKSFGADDTSECNESKSSHLKIIKVLYHYHI